MARTRSAVPADSGQLALEFYRSSTFEREVGRIERSEDPGALGMIERLKVKVLYGAYRRQP